MTGLKIILGSQGHPEREPGVPRGKPVGPKAALGIPSLAFSLGSLALPACPWPPIIIFKPAYDEAYISLSGSPGKHQKKGKEDIRGGLRERAQRRTGEGSLTRHARRNQGKPGGARGSLCCREPSIVRPRLKIQNVLSGVYLEIKNHL